MGLVWEQIPPQGRFSPEARVGSLTALVTGAAEEWSSMGTVARRDPGQNPAYRPSARFFGERRNLRHRVLSFNLNGLPVSINHLESVWLMENYRVVCGF